MNTYGECPVDSASPTAPASASWWTGSSGERIDLEEVRVQMRRRAPGSTELGTPRKETDEPLILSSLYHNQTTGLRSRRCFKTAIPARPTTSRRSPDPATRTIPRR